MTQRDGICHSGMQTTTKQEDADRSQFFLMRPDNAILARSPSPTRTTAMNLPLSALWSRAPQTKPPRRLHGGLWLGLAVCLAGLWSGGVLGAGDVFDAEYTDCPGATRLAALTGLAVTPTTEADVLEVSWQGLTESQIADLGTLRHRSGIAAIVEGSVEPQTQMAAPEFCTPFHSIGSRGTCQTARYWQKTKQGLR